MKTCAVCNSSKPEEEFEVKKGKVTDRCKACKREYDRSYYRANKIKISSQRRGTNNSYAERNRNYVIDVLLKSACIDCGFKDIRALQFDHRDDVVKLGHISDMIHGGYSLKAIQDEIAKCDVRCANCHSIRTCKQFNHFKAQFASMW